MDLPHPDQDRYLGDDVIALLLASLAFAAVPADVITAANEDLPEAERMAAFQRVVSNYPSYKADLWDLAKAEEVKMIDQEAAGK